MTVADVTLIISSPQDKDANGWISYGEFCYYFSTVSLNFNDAFNHCLGLESLLVSIGSQEENYFLQKNSKTECWIGMYRPQCWFDQSKNNHWLDGTEFKFVNWDVGEPNENTCCVKMLPATGKWRDRLCSISYNFVCKKPLSVNPNQQKRAIRRVIDSYIVGDSLEVVPNKGCLIQLCMLMCIRNWMCAGFNMRPELQNGCTCELKDDRNWLTFDSVQKVGASYWSYPIRCKIM
ncbi:hypothetical protein HELRODRAFT_178093 [Helobdella robusta]|uniref:C-type lectin domain-containing protein n=1 Tax=Helobdella robusta TaxID=6412 RepID=T1FCQ3_HELRO|nr:hypothetical protein HELRODRAFT_178093 [Helobdella robusta]ESN97308.1 hypothetical protein HELRODRAFT_178093 [Helobdella robusta]